MAMFEIIEAKPYHCGQIIRILRHEHAQALRAYGNDFHRKLRTAFDSSAYRRAWLIDGKLAAVGGVTGTLMAPQGFLWLAVSQMATRYRVAMVKEAQAQIDMLLRVKTDLFAVTIVGDKTAQRFARHLGFLIQHPLDNDGLLLWGIKPLVMDAEPYTETVRLH